MKSNSDDILVKRAVTDDMHFNTDHIHRVEVKKEVTHVTIHTCISDQIRGSKYSEVIQSIQKPPDKSSLSIAAVSEVAKSAMMAASPNWQRLAE